ncbi:hypothetical protein OSB04_022552 [Centaurea solstitialis]|uniref:D-isomer specific 2-hydroxyacid dehydrogenase catalytic domain-containing protein n=1 Tax=Centaurea solstitialis TaxID=347529 RepID=A0AA38WHD2_9ASTR|nr:hypothetical protein OSB04_022552 [Centaurea solstitialis]
MADLQPPQSTITTTTTTTTAATDNNNRPVAIIHHLPMFSLSFFPWISEIVNPIHVSDPLFSIHGPRARAVIVLGPSPLKSEHLDQYPSVEIVIGTSAGVDHIDLAECSRRNIKVTGAGDAFSEDVADYAVALLLDVLRRVSAADRYVRNGLWPVNGEYPLGNKVTSLEVWGESHTTRVQIRRVTFMRYPDFRSSPSVAGSRPVWKDPVYGIHFPAGRVQP